MNKPTLTAEQAKAFEALKNVWERNWEYGKHCLISEKLDEGWPGDDEFTPASEISNDDFIAAIYVGYEVEKTPEQRVREFYELNEPSTWDGDYTLRGRQQGIVKTLNILGITIEGVNN